MEVTSKNIVPKQKPVSAGDRNVMLYSEVASPSQKENAVHCLMLV